ncbi:MAG TPA: GIY-YIG nuclease family protein [Candidatus Woesebacteria bacterium]|nr:GIY-YIG nuclease family protein [Candidatus Woesebacteria bacterium]HNS95232.1 GIY-YIG nuclease family protein [Candidatus Woesebacteria bacterium]
MKSIFVYIVECSDASYYTGITNNVELRVWQHNQGIDVTAYTYTRRPVVLRYFQEFTNPDEAIAFEKQVKGWSRRKKTALIMKDIERLKELANFKSHASSILR